MRGLALLPPRARSLGWQGQGGDVRDVCTAALLFALPAPELVYVSWAVVHQIALRGGGPPQMSSSQGERQEATAFVTAACQLSAQPSPLSAFSSALRGGCFPEPLFGSRTKATRTSSPQQTAWVSPTEIHSRSMDAAKAAGGRQIACGDQDKSLLELSPGSSPGCSRHQEELVEALACLKCPSSPAMDWS